MMSHIEKRCRRMCRLADRKLEKRDSAWGKKEKYKTENLIYKAESFSYQN